MGEPRESTGRNPDAGFTQAVATDQPRLLDWSVTPCFRMPMRRWPGPC